MVWIALLVVIVFVLPLSLGAWLEQGRVKRASRKILKPLAKTLGATYPRPLTNSAASSIALSVAGHPSYIFHALTFPNGGDNAVPQGRVIVTFQEADLDDATVRATLEQKATHDPARTAILHRTTVDSGELTIAFDDLAPEGLTQSIAYLEDTFLELERAALPAPQEEEGAYRTRQD